MLLVQLERDSNSEQPFIPSALVTPITTTTSIGGNGVEGNAAAGHRPR